MVALHCIERIPVLAAIDIQEKIKRGLSKAINKTGSSSSDLVYVEKITISGGNSPLDPPVRTPANVLLVDAIFKSYDRSLIGGTIKAGDRELVSNSDVEILMGERIIQGPTSYTVIDVDVKAPTSDVLAYIAQVRVQ
jgi:hypothetical protein